MRATDSQNGLTALAIAGTNVVLVGWDMPEADIRNLGILGFSLQRRRHFDGDVTWLSGMKTFKSVDPDPAPGVPVSTFSHPLQTFQWSDYSVAPNLHLSPRRKDRAARGFDRRRGGHLDGDNRADRPR